MNAQLKTSELLIQAKALIDSPDKWIQGEAAQDAEGNSRHTFESAACKFCSMGAIAKISDGTHDKRRRMRVALQLALPDQFDSIIHYNDSTTHADLMTTWDSAIAMATLAELENQS